MKLHEMESSGRPISITGICAQASVSRANLYERHPDLVLRIREPAKLAKRSSTATVTITDLRKSLANEKKKSKALYYLCVELFAEIHRLRVRATTDSTLPAGKSRGRRKS